MTRTVIKKMQAMYEARSCNQCCSGKSILHNLSVCL